MKNSGDKKKGNIEIKKPLKSSAYAGVLFISTFFILAIINQILTVIGLESSLIISSIIFAFLLSFFGISFLYGFIILGKKFENKLLVVLTYGIIILFVLYLVIAVFGNLFIDFSKVTNDPVLKEYLSSQNPGKELSFEDLKPETQDFIIKFAKIIIFAAAFISLYLILFGVALFKLKDRVKYSKAAGILNIISGVTFVIIIGIFIKLIAFILEIIMFFEASRKFEDSKKIKR